MSAFVSSNNLKKKFLTYLEKKCKFNCFHELDSAIPPALSPLHCPTQSFYQYWWLLKNSTGFWSGICKVPSFWSFEVVGNCISNLWRSEEVLAEFSQSANPVPQEGLHTLPLRRKMGYNSLAAEAAIQCPPPASQAGVLQKPRSYFRHTNYPEGIRHVPCHEWPLVAQDPELQ